MINGHAWRLLPATMPERWSQVCRVEITFGLLTNNLSLHLARTNMHIETRAKNSNGARVGPTVTRAESCADLMNRVLTKNEGPHPKKSVRKSRNKCRVNSWSVGAHGQLTRGSNGLSPETNTNAQRILLVSCLLRSSLHPLAPNC